MQSITCRGCCSQLDSVAKAKNVFVNALTSESESTDGQQNVSTVERIVTISSGLELVTGYSISKNDGLSPYLCNECTEKLKTYINFRKQLLSARKLLMNSKFSGCGNISETLEAVTPNREITRKNSEKEEIIKREFINSTESAKSSLDNFQEQSSPGNINVDDISMSSVFDDSPKTKYGTPDNRRDQDNNNSNVSESSNLSVDVRTNEMNGFKNPIHDVESDIDVCSGEEDDVLELDVPSKKDETIEIGSSSESEIEVCDNDEDYTPIVKRV